MKLEDFTIGFLHECFLMDPVTGVMTWKVRPSSHFANEARTASSNAQRAGKVAGTMQESRRRYVIHCCGKYISAHRIVFALSRQIDLKDVPMIVDHIDGNPSNNAPDNLRGANYLESTANRGMLSSNTSGYKGAKYHKRDKAWISSIVYTGKTVHLGTFRTKEEAGAAYQAAAKILHGKYFREITQPADAAV